MDLPTLATLVVIALIDSTSIGTLVVPLWLMLDTRRSAWNVLVYLATLSGFYFAVGAVLLLGARYTIDAVGDQIAEFLATTAGGYVVLAAGVGLVVASFAMDPKRRRRAREARGQGERQSWTERASARPPRTGSTIGLAIGAGTLEVATMLPYFAAMGIISTATLPSTVRFAVLAGYVTVMALPALVLLAVRHTAGTRVTDGLDRLRAWLMKHSAGTVSLLLLLVGIHVVLRGLALVR